MPCINSMPEGPENCRPEARTDSTFDAIEAFKSVEGPRERSAVLSMHLLTVRHSRNQIIVVRMFWYNNGTKAMIAQEEQGR